MTTAPVNPELATAGAHFWQGSFIDDEEAARRLAELPDLAAQALAEPLPTELVLSACQHVADALATSGSPVRTRLLAELTGGGVDSGEAAATLAEITGAIARPALERKLRRELGGLRPERLTRPDARETTFEAWAPVGLLVHIAPGNAAAVAPLSVIEGLLTGNLNVLKTSSADTPLAQHLLAELAAADPTGTLARRIVALRFPSARTEWLRLMMCIRDRWRSGAARTPSARSPNWSPPAAAWSNGGTGSPSPT